jgi:hypothetical protein
MWELERGLRVVTLDLYLTSRLDGTLVAILLRRLQRDTVSSCKSVHSHTSVPRGKAMSGWTLDVREST